MKKALIGLIASGLVLFGANNCLAQDVLRVEKGVGAVYDIFYGNRKPFLELAGKSPKEDSWICFDWKCYDVGFNESENSVHVDTNEVMRLVRSNNWKGVVYSRHNHPDFSPPSDNDIITHLKLESKLKKLGANLISEAFTGEGHWRYDVSPALRRDIGRSYTRDDLAWYNETFWDVNLLPISRDDKVGEFISRVGRRGVMLSYVGK